MGTNETYIDRVDLLEYWRMSSAYMHTRYGRMLWTADHYTKRYFSSELNLHRTRVYKSLDRIINTYS